ncbi:MAG TPA: alpha/beta hydrolase [Steroidobacteraceae bacterium]|jgi:pimeloyl-ACP methyl ester carboxylesterase
MSDQTLRPPHCETLTVRGLRHRVTWWGERSRSPVVLLHGFQDCGATWQFLADRLPPDWSLAAPDWRGFGHTDWAAGGYWFPDYFADLEALLQVLVPEEPARIVGHSMGANIAAIYCGVRPQRLAWLVSLEGFGLPRTQPGDAPARYTRWLDELQQAPREGRYPSVAQLARYLRARNTRLTPERALFIAGAWTRPAPTASEATAIELLFDPRHRLVNPVLYRREEAEACWERIQAPVLLVRGDAGDDSRSSSMRTAAAETATHIRDHRIVAVPGAGHMLHHEEPEVLAQHIVEFERACRGRLRAEPPPTT